jgi:nucleoid-associated protein YgaU
MFNRNIVLSAFLSLVMLALLAGGAVAADRMTYEDFQIQLKAYQDREQAARDAIAVEQKAIDELKAQIAAVVAQIEATWNEIFATLGITREDYLAFLAAIGALEARVDELGRLAPDKLLERAKELDELEAEVNQMLANKIAKLLEPQNRLQRLAARIAGLKNSLPKPKHDIYTVLRGDYLWRISGKQDIYGDPWKWMRIYSANRTDIKDPDLIYPNQQFRIPRQIGRDEHLVARGEFLAKIAGYPEVYGDPFKWTKIYQANKSGEFLRDPNLIYPEQILSIPRD